MKSDKVIDREEFWRAIAREEAISQILLLHQDIVLLNRTTH